MLFFKRKKTIIALIVIVAVAVTSIGFFRSRDVENINKDSLVYANAKDIGDINPHLYSGEIFAQNLVFESLVKINDDGSVSPWLAKSWTISKDGKTYVFKLRDDVYFTDGVKFNANVAKQNFDAILDNAKRHAWAGSVSLMKAVDDAGGKSVEATGEYELTIRLSKSYYPFLIELGLTRPFRFISPNCFINGTTKNGVNGEVGTGPYYLSQKKQDEYALFKANENYWGGKPSINEITVKVIPDNQSRIMALENGEVDLIYGSSSIDAETYNKFKNSTKYSVSISNPIATRMIMLNTQNQILNDLKVRQAIEYATDRDSISKYIFLGIENPAYTIFSSNVPYANIGLKPYSYDVEKAKKLLDEAGWVQKNGEIYREKDGNQLELTLVYSLDNSDDKTLAEFYQSELKKVGIKLNIRGEESQSLKDRLKSGDFDITFNETWGAPYDPQSFLNGMREASVHGDYQAQKGLAEKDKIDDAILNALMSTNEEKRQEYYTYVINALQNEAVYVPLTYQTNRAIYSNKVGNVTFNPSQYEVPIEKMTINK